MNEELTECNKEYLIKQLEYSYKEIERLNTNLEVANEDLTRIAQLLNLEEGCTIYDIEDKIERLNNIIKEVREYIEENCYKKMGGYGDNEDNDIEVCLFEDDIWELKEILDKGE